MQLENAKTPVLFFSNAIGDAYIALPAIRAINDIYNGNLRIITRSFYKYLFSEEGFNHVETIEVNATLNEEGAIVNHFDIQEFRKCLEGADLFIDINPWHITDNFEEYVAMLDNEKIHTIGFFKCYKDWIKPDFSINSFDNAFNIVRAIDGKRNIEDYAYPPKLNENIESFVQRVKHTFDDDFIIIGVQDETKEYKMWVPGKFEQLLNQLLSRYDNLGIIIMSKSTSINLDNITEKERVLYFEESFPVTVMAGLLHITDFFIGIDSMFLHLADLYKIPAVGLFGPTSHKEWGFRFTKGKEVVSITGKMEDIPVEEVLNSVITMIEQHVQISQE